MTSNQGEVPEAVASPNVQDAECACPDQSSSSYLNLQEGDPTEVTDVTEVIL